MNYLNEYDRHAAAWLRELIADGLIADAVVDERSIEDVLPSDLVGFDQCHFFAGIGGWPLALRSAGWPDDRPVWTGSCPCQPFSTAGKGSGTADERHLWPAWHHLIRERRPAVLFGEQVEAAIGHGWLDLVHDDLEDLGYSFGAAGLPAACAGAPHIRQRLWFVAHADQGRRADPGRQRHPRGSAGAVRHGQPLVLADGSSIGRQRWPDAGGSTGQVPAERGEGLPDAERGRIPGRVADSCSPGLEGGERAGQRDDAQRAAAERSGAADVVADTDGSDGRQGPGLVGRERPAQSGEAHHWANAEWILCRDGKRRPVEPGIQPLAHGVPGRVGLLRGSGNAIVPPVAQAFIEECMRCIS